MRLSLNGSIETSDYDSSIVRWRSKHETGIGHLPVTMATIVPALHSRTASIITLSNKYIYIHINTYIYTIFFFFDILSFFFQMMNAA